ncbi:F-box protein At5g07610-like [Diospyros lotus]|uniref:F-box protein At5g07610-like n=1 Tax=Diospyros lotus TaxID=55363 RepID=UPI00225ABDE7|nr:F-box protein At5g07610-like [Diospyros lotus]
MAKSTSLAVEKVLAIEDLLSEILSRLPKRSLFRFKSVSKAWLSLISNPLFSLCPKLDPRFMSGLFLYPFDESIINPNYNLKLGFIPLSNDKVQDINNDDVTFIPTLSGIIVLSSCHGLLLCNAYNEIECKKGFHVLNPTTKQFKTLPEPHLDGFFIKGITLAFEPSRSPHYKVVIVWCSTRLCNFRIEVYSSETGFWRASGEPFTVNAHIMLFGNGVYWNGAVHWCCDWGDGLYFDVEKELLQIMPLPPLPEEYSWYDRIVRRQMESCDHLHIVDIYNTSTQISVFELERDYSGWFEKYRVDLDIFRALSPEVLWLVDEGRLACEVLAVGRVESDEKSYLILHIPQKIICYNPVYKTFKDISSEGIVNKLPYYGAYQYIESYSSVW